MADPLRPALSSAPSWLATSLFARALRLGLGYWGWPWPSFVVRPPSPSWPANAVAPPRCKRGRPSPVQTRSPRVRADSSPMERQTLMLAVQDSAPAADPGPAPTSISVPTLVFLHRPAPAFLPKKQMQATRTASHCIMAILVPIEVTDENCGLTASNAHRRVNGVIKTVYFVHTRGARFLVKTRQRAIRSEAS